MEANYTIRRSKKSGVTTFFLQPEDTIKQWSWLKLKMYLEKNGGVYRKNRHSHEFEEDPAELMEKYVSENCSEFIPKKVDFRHVCKAKTGIDGPRGEQDRIQARLDNSKRGPVQKKRVYARTMPSPKLSELDLLKKRNLELTAELQRLKGEEIELKEKKAIRDRDLEEKKEVARQVEIKEKKSRLRAGKLEIISAKTVSELTKYRDKWQGVEEMDQLISSRIMDIKESDEKGRTVDAKKKIIDALCSMNNETVKAEWLLKLGIDPGGDTTKVYGITLLRCYLFNAYIIQVPDNYTPKY